MDKFEFIALEYKLKHAKSKKAVIDSYPELKGKSVSEVNGLIQAATFARTGRTPKQQQAIKRKQYTAIQRRTNNGKL